MRKNIYEKKDYEKKKKIQNLFVLKKTKTRLKKIHQKKQNFSDSTFIN